MLDAEVAQDRIADHRARGLEPGTRFPQLRELSPDRVEAREVRALAVRRRPLALQHDDFDRALGRGEIVDREQSRQRKLLDADLGFAVADEHALLAEHPDEACEPLQHAVVQMTLADVVLRRGRQQIRTHGTLVVGLVGEPRAVDELNALGVAGRLSIIAL